MAINIHIPKEKTSHLNGLSTRGIILSSGALNKGVPALIIS